jgi:MFS family permease
MMPVVILGFAFFLLTAMAGGGIMNFGISALHEGYGVALATATLVIGFYQGGSVVGNILGGVMADRTRNHQRTAITGVAVGAVFALLAAFSSLPFPVIVAFLLIAGFAFGAVLPSRDILIRNAAPAGGLGKVFGTVYSGLDAGSLIGPLVFGALLDHGLPEFVFVGVALGMALAIPTVMAFRPSAPRETVAATG